MSKRSATGLWRNARPTSPTTTGALQKPGSSQPGHSSQTTLMSRSVVCTNWNGHPCITSLMACVCFFHSTKRFYFIAAATKRKKLRWPSVTCKSPFCTSNHNPFHPPHPLHVHAIRESHSLSHMCKKTALLCDRYMLHVRYIDYKGSVANT